MIFRRIAGYVGTVLLSFAVVASALGQTPVHRYSFDSPADGRTVTDSIGGADGQVISDSDNFSFVDGQLDLSSNIGEGSNNIIDDAYVDLPNGIISAAVRSGTDGAISLEWWATVTETHTWSRFGDFGGSNDGEDTSASGNQSEYILVTPNSGRFGDGLEITNHPASNAAEPNVGVQGPFELDTEAHVVAIYDHTDTDFGDNGTMTLYLGGEFQGSNEIHPDVDLRTMDDYNNWLGRSQWNDPLFVGTFNEFRIYDVALTEEQVAQSFEAGPDADFGGGGLGPLDDGTLTDPQERADYVHNVLNTWVGDSDLDGQFNSSDLVFVLGAGQYEDATAGNSSWVTGDWNGDKEFDTSDFVAALADGGYEQGPRAAVNAVPEPTTWFIFALGMLGIATLRRRIRCWVT